ncbi:MAG TPA: hypothetical protein VK921_03565 [Anditalea sp.]|nr:hypothetical protein [Anditalea sp.]
MSTITGNTIYNIISKVESIVRGPVSEGISLGTWANRWDDKKHNVVNKVNLKYLILVIK